MPNKHWPNTWTEVEDLGNGKFAASITAGHRVFFDKADGNKPKKHKLTDERPGEDYVLIQGAQCCVEVHPYYAKYFDVQHEKVRLYEERWVVQRLFKEPDEWRDVDNYNPVMVVEEYPEPAGDVVKVTVTYDTDYGALTVEYFQRDGVALKHNVFFKNTSGSTETFRVLQKWAGIVGEKVNGQYPPTKINTPFFAFHKAGKPSEEFIIAENATGIMQVGLRDILEMLTGSREFVVGETVLVDTDGIKLAVEGYHAYLWIDGEEVMSSTSGELSGMVKAVEDCPDNARIFIGGLGLGVVLLPLFLSGKATEIIVCERDQRVIDAIAPLVQAYFGNRLNLQIIQGDAAVEVSNHGKFDWIFMDFFYGDEANDANEEWLRNLSIPNLNTGGVYTAFYQLSRESRVPYLQPVEVKTHAQGMKADFVYSNWILAQDESLEIDPDTTTISPPGQAVTVSDVSLGGFWVKFDVSSIAGGTATLAKLQCYQVVLGDVGGVPDTDANFWNVNNQGWTEALSAAEIFALAVSDLTAQASGFGDGNDTYYDSADIATIVNVDIEASNTYCSIRVWDDDYPPISGNDKDVHLTGDLYLGRIWGRSATRTYHQFAGKGAGNPPKLYVEYDLGGEPEIYERSAAVAIGIISTALRNLIEAREASVATGITASADKPALVLGRFASTSIGITASAHQFMHYIKASVAIGVAATALRLKRVLRLASVAVGIDAGAPVSHIFERLAAVAIGIASTASRSLVGAREASVDVGVAVNSLRIKVVHKLASVAIGVTATASITGKVFNRLASTAVGVTASAKRNLALTTKSASVSIGIAVTALRVKVIHKSASVAIGIVVSARRSRIFIRKAAVAIGIRVWEGYQKVRRNAAVAVGMAISASRTVVYGRSASVVIGVATTASRNIALTTKIALVALGIAVSALRLKRVLRIASVDVGVAVAASITGRILSRLASVAVGITASASRNLALVKSASVEVGIVVSALRLKRVLRVASVAVGILALAQTATIITKYFRYASVAIGIAVSATRVKVIHQAASVAVGITVFASRVKGVVRVASVAVGIAVSVSRALVILREAAVETGITIAAYRHKRVLRKAAVDIGIIATADITGKALNRLASVAVGVTASALRNLALTTKSASVLIGIAVSATSGKVKVYIASVAIGVAVSASRGLSLAREASVDIGIDATALRIKVVHKLAPVAIGIIVSALRLKRVLRVASVEIGITVGASRALKLAREAVVEVGIAVSALRVKVVHITALVLIGITAGAQTVTVITKYFRYAAVAIGVAVSASKSIIVNRYASTAIGIAVSALKTKTIQRFATVAIGVAVSASRALVLAREALVEVGIAVSVSKTKTIQRFASIEIGISVSALRIKIRQRWASVAIGVAVSATRIKVIHRVALVAVGIAVSASRSLILGRFASVAVGVTAWATRVWYRRHLVGTLITAQYRNVQMITAQYRLASIITARYRKALVTTSQYRLVQVITTTYRKVKLIIS